VTRVSVTASGGEATGGASGSPAISADGNVVAFASLADNLAAGDGNLASDVFVRVFGPGATTERVSVDDNGVGGNLQSSVPAISADGRFVAFQSAATNLVTPDANGATVDVYVFDRTTDQIERVNVDGNGVQANGDSGGLAISADGRYVAFASMATNFAQGATSGDFHVYVYDRMADTLDLVSVNHAGVPANDHNLSPSISADGRFVAFDSFATNLVPGDLNMREDVFVFDRVTRKIERLSVNSRDEEGDDSSIFPRMSADGRYVAFHSFATNLIEGDGNGLPDVYLQDRDTDTLERVSLGSLGEEGNGFSTFAALSADGRHVAFESESDTFVGTSDTNAVADVYVRTIDVPAILRLNGDLDLDDTVLQVFDTGTSSLRPVPRTAAAAVAVASQRAAIITSEEDEGGTILNADGDSFDRVAQLYDGVSDTLVSLGRAASQVAISADLVALTTPEAEQFGIDANGDGDPFDEVLAIHPIGGSPPAQNAFVAADAIAVTATSVALITDEAAEDATDLNGDDDTVDRVLRVYDQPTGIVTEVEEAAEELVVGGLLVAFRTPEAAQGGADLNLDGDTADLVMQIYDIESDTVISTGQAAILCTLPGCEPFTPYKVKGDTVSFLTREPDQGGTDLNGDGDGIDTVAQIFNVRTGTIQVVELSAEQPNLPPFPDESFEGPILYVEASEPELGRDLNGDGDQNDIVVLLGADSDDDETFDDFDTCTEVANAEQEDSDLDGLGDSCDPTAFCGEFIPPAPVPAPALALDCQQAAGKAVLKYVKQRESTVAKCLDAIAAGKLDGDPTGTCRGSFVGGVDALPDDEKTARKLAKAADKLRATLASRCTPSAVALLDACASAPADLADCVLAAYGSAANAATRLTHGDVEALPGKAERACQSAAGKASTAYLQSVVKAMHACLDRLSTGSLSGDAQALCLGRLDVGGVVSPTDSKTGRLMEAAESKLLASLAKKCPGSTLDALDACGADPTSATTCLACTHWRRAVEAVRSLYGPP
jgi:Tol biopolymer transport system component